MARFLSKKDKKLWTAPGTPEFIGRVHVEAPQVEIVAYDEESIDDQICGIEDWKAHYAVLKRSQWVNVTGIHRIDPIREYMHHLGLHILTQEDIFNTTQRPKFEEHDTYLVVILRMIYFDETETRIDSEQISLLLHSGGLLTLQERPKDVFGPVRERLLRPTTRIRHRGTDYLLFALIDTILDHYFAVAEKLGERIEAHEEVIAGQPTESDRARINHFKNDINMLRKHIRPVKEVVLQLKKTETQLIQGETQPFFRELEDNLNVVLDALEFYREQLNDLVGLYNARQDQRLNEIIRLLTIFSVIFIPLTFLAGIYGTNFKYLPELEYRWAYPVFWGVLLALAGGMIYYFRKHKWF